jgi:AcrR family transcriptional regulator
VTPVTQRSKAGAPRRRMAASDRRLAILYAARSAFAEGGFHQTSLDAVAERAGVSKALIYEHFESKRALY